jgi:hypothetical protein
MLLPIGGSEATVLVDLVHIVDAEGLWSTAVSKARAISRARPEGASRDLPQEHAVGVANAFF